MSKNEKHRLAEIQIPILNHPEGRRMCSMLRARDMERRGRGVILEGVLHWFNYSRDTQPGYFGRTQGEWKIQTGADGHVGVHWQQGLMK